MNKNVSNINNLGYSSAPYTLLLPKSGVLEIRNYLKSELFLAVQNIEKIVYRIADTGVEPKNPHSSTKL